MFITFEGIEGSGKSTQIRLLADALKMQGRDVVVTREPGGTAIGDKIRKILLDNANKSMAPLCEALLYWAARAQHVEELIAPALRRFAVVLCDRYVDSTIAYQGYARGLDFAGLAMLRAMVMAGLGIDKTFLFDLPVEEGLSRARGRMSLVAQSEREDRFENEVVSFHQKVRDGFLAMAGREPERFVILDARQKPDELHAQVIGLVEGWLK